jgi:hypothetical protein
MSHLYEGSGILTFLIFFPLVGAVLAWLAGE